MGKANLAVNRLLERREVFADLINGSIYGGQPVLKSEDLELISVSSGIFYEGEHGKRYALERRGDVRMRAELETYSLILANESQSSVHYAMPVRNMLYDALEYTKQVQEFEKKHKESGELLTGGAFLSGMTKDDRLLPVITTVLFWGAEWDGPESLYEMMGLDISDGTKPALKSFLPNYKINLIDIRSMENLEVFHSCLQPIFSMIKCSKDKAELYKYMHSHGNELKQLDSVEQMAAMAMLGEEKRLAKLLENHEGTGGFDMCKAIDDLIEDGRLEGIAAGRAEGETKKLIKQVCRKLYKGKTPKMIAEDLDEDTVVIDQICIAAKNCAPEYDPDCIYEHLTKNTAS